MKSDAAIFFGDSQSFQSLKCNYHKYRKEESIEFDFRFFFYERQDFFFNPIRGGVENRH